MQEEEKQKECLHKLCEAIEAKVERKMQTTRDYDLLAECIFQELHQQISPTTLKRIWGYLPCFHIRYTCPLRGIQKLGAVLWAISNCQ